MFLKRSAPENRRLRRWWMFLAQLKLNIYRVPGLKNELCDWLSREKLDETMSASSEACNRIFLGTRVLFDHEVFQQN